MKSKLLIFLSMIFILLSACSTKDKIISNNSKTIDEKGSNDKNVAEKNNYVGSNTSDALVQKSQSGNDSKNSLNHHEAVELDNYKEYYSKIEEKATCIKKPISVDDALSLFKSVIPLAQNEIIEFDHLTDSGNIVLHHFNYNIINQETGAGDASTLHWFEFDPKAGKIIFE